MLECLLYPRCPIRVANIGRVCAVIPSSVHSIHTSTAPKNSINLGKASIAAPLITIKGTAASKILDGQDHYAYTSGRWLHRDKLQRDAQFVQFDFSALCKRVAELCPEYGEIKNCTKKEGGFNRVFIFQMEYGRIVARIPFRTAGPGMLTTHSEVATMAYIRQKTDIPVPKILEWNGSKSNALGTEYIIMEHAPGVQLHGKWPDMNSVQHMRCIRALSKMIKSMAALTFSAYGSIYFADAPIDSNLKIRLGNGFCLGPNCMREYWNCNPGEFRYYQEKNLNSGPWHNLHEYCVGLLDQGFSRIPIADSAPKNELPYRGSVQEHHRLLKISGEVVGALEKSTILQNLTTPTLLHADLHKRNIFVSEDDPTIITSIIDWQSTSIEPAFAFADETPDLVNRNSVPESMLSEAGQEGEADDIDEDSEVAKQRKAIQKDEWLCYQTFEIDLKVDAPKLSAARNADQNLLRPLRYCGTSWRDSAAATRQELIELSQRWKDIGLPGECPYQPSNEELADHTTQYDEFEMRQGFLSLLNEMISTSSEGWVHSENWEAAKESHKETFEWWLDDAEQSDEPGISAEYIEKLWPFDIEKKQE